MTWILRRRAELVLMSVALLVGLGLLELGGRLAVARQLRLPVLHSAEQRFYPELHSGMRGYDPSADNVLLLGGSVLQRIPLPVWSREDPGRHHHSVAFKAHTSLDSLYKYEALLRRGYRFDQVVFYHGINDVRTNNVPSELFAPDYSHYAYYRMAHRIFRDRETLRSRLVRSTYLGYTLELWRHLNPDAEGLLPPDLPPREWRSFGAAIRSAESFRRNLVAIAELAEAAGSRLVVPRFSYHHPDGYSFDAWRRRRLGYTCDRRGSATHIWGAPENVVAGIEAHNRVIDEESGSGRFVVVDTDPISEHLEYFCDICHFSSAGTDRFAVLVTRALDSPTGDRSSTTSPSG